MQLLITTVLLCGARAYCTSSYMSIGTHSSSVSESPLIVTSKKRHRRLGLAWCGMPVLGGATYTRHLRIDMCKDPCYAYSTAALECAIGVKAVSREYPRPTIPTAELADGCVYRHAFSDPDVGMACLWTNRCVTMTCLYRRGLQSFQPMPWQLARYMRPFIHHQLFSGFVKPPEKCPGWP